MSWKAGAMGAKCVAAPLTSLWLCPGYALSKPHYPQGLYFFGNKFSTELMVTLRSKLFVCVCVHVRACACVWIMPAVGTTAIWGATYWLWCATGVLCPQCCLYFCAACTEQLDPWCSRLPLQEVSDVSDTSHQGAR